MRILLVSGTDEESDLFKNKVDKTIKQILNNEDNRLGIILPAIKTEIEMESPQIVKYRVDCKGDKSMVIPKFTPKQVNDLNNFLTEFNPDIIHSFDEGLLALLTEFWAIRKRIPFLLSLGNIIENSSSLTDKILQKLLAPFGFNERFIGNFYHNSTAINYDNYVQKEFIEKIEYKGKLIDNNKNGILDIYKDLIESQKKYTESQLFSNIIKYIPTDYLKDSIKDINSRKFNIKGTFWFLAAIIGSFLTYFSIKRKKKEDNK